MTDNYNSNKEGILNLMQCKCPRCRKGNMFTFSNPYNLKNFMKMNEKCPVCEQSFDMEPGFYYGTSYVSYAFTIALTVVGFFAWWAIIGLSVNDDRVFYWLIANAVLLLLIQPILMRLARTVWLAFFVRYDEYWAIHEAKRPYSTNKEQQHAW